MSGINVGEQIASGMYIIVMRAAAEEGEAVWKSFRASVQICDKSEED